MNRGEKVQEAGGVLQLLDRQAPDGYLAEWTQRVAAPATVQEADLFSAVVFRVGVEWLALDTGAVRAVAGSFKLHGLPHVGGFVQGIVTVEGELLVCVALGLLLGQPEQGAGTADTQRLLVAGRGDIRTAFVVDEIAEVVSFSASALREVPTTLRESMAVYTRGMLPWQGYTVGYLDEALLFHTLNKKLS